jgi:hypothetical protein
MAFIDCINSRRAAPCGPTFFMNMFKLLDLPENLLNLVVSKLQKRDNPTIRQLIDQSSSSKRCSKVVLCLQPFDPCWTGNSRMVRACRASTSGWESASRARRMPA